MSRIEAKARYIGTWREDVVSDHLMRQIIARSHAEKGEKVKVKLSKDGLYVVRTVLFQENSLTSFPLRDVYFLTVNQHHPSCLLAIAADPVRKYVIVALKTNTPFDAQQLIATFQSLKENPRINAGNVVLKRKENGNWTLRDRSQHNADRHLQDLFKEHSESGSLPPSPVSPQPNGAPGGYAPVIDGGKVARISVNNSHPNTTGLLIVDGSEGSTHNDVEQLTQELRDMKTIVEGAGSNRSSYNGGPHFHNNNNNHEKSHYFGPEVHAVGGVPHTNGHTGIVSAHSPGGHLGDKPGEARAVVEDFRGTSSGGSGVVSANSYVTVTTPRSTAPVTITTSVLPDKPPQTLISNGRVQRQITVPPVKVNDATDGMSPIVITSTTDSPATTPRLHTTYTKAPATNGFTDVPDYVVHRRVSSQYVPVASSRRVSSAEPSRSNSYRVVTFDPEVVKRNQDRQEQFRSLRKNKGGIPTTVIRPIEETYGHGTLRLVHPTHTYHQPRPSILKRHPPHSQPMLYNSADGALYVSTAPHPSPTLNHSVYVPQQSPGSHHHHHHPQQHYAPSHHHPHYSQPSQHSARRSRPNSVSVVEGGELRVYHTAGEVDDVLL